MLGNIISDLKWLRIGKIYSWEPNIRSFWNWIKYFAIIDMIEGAWPFWACWRPPENNTTYSCSLLMAHWFLCTEWEDASHPGQMTEGLALFWISFWNRFLFINTFCCLEKREKAADRSLWPLRLSEEAGKQAGGWRPRDCPYRCPRCLFKKGSFTVIFQLMYLDKN